MACKRQVTSTTSAVAITVENFPDSNLRSFLLAQPYGTDSLLTDEEIAATTSLNLSGLDISDLTGIQHFTALKDLACVGNQLTTLDIAGLTSLNYLNCASNQLTELHLTDLPTLNYLDCGQNRLVTLDLIHLPSLHVLSCPDNQLTTLDFSHNPSITTVICCGNQLHTQAIDTLISSLPHNATNISHSLYLCNSQKTDEQNTCTPQQVATAKSKGWTTYHYTAKDWQKY